MRTAVLSLVVAMSGCALARSGRINEGATALDPACASAKYDFEEVEPWLWRVKCGKGVIVWCQGADVEPMRCTRERPETERSRREKAMRDYLACPTGELKTSRVDFDNRNKLADPYRWGELQIEGCGRLGWWGNKGNGDRMLDPPDLEIALNQLAVESGCAEPARQVQHYGNRVQGTYRLEACGRAFACSVPLFADERSGTAVPASVAGNQASCKAALETPVPDVQP